MNWSRITQGKHGLSNVFGHSTDSTSRLYWKEILEILVYMELNFKALREILILWRYLSQFLDTSKMFFSHKAHQLLQEFFLSSLSIPSLNSLKDSVAESWFSLHLIIPWISLSKRTVQYSFNLICSKFSIISKFPALFNALRYWPWIWN